jgi:hypothetical protein
MGQTNMAAGATVGSNHNSRGADGELIAGRGFWPGLCVSIKHNSRFSSFIIMAKGNYPAELDIPIPFSLVSNDMSNDELIIMPAYWFMHNMYALARNAWKYGDRDKRQEKIQLLEYDYLAPDSITEIASGIEQLQLIVARSWLHHQSQSTITREDILARNNIYADLNALKKQGKHLLENNDPALHSISFFAEGYENSSRKIRVIKLLKAYAIFNELITHYAIEQILINLKSGQYNHLSEFQASLPENKNPASWVNAGGQLVQKSSLDELITGIHQETISGWKEIHQFYSTAGENYPKDKLYHALDILFQVHGISIKEINQADFKKLLLESVATAEWITKGIFNSRKKDYLNPFRKMVYESQDEMDQVVGKLDDNSFINNQEKVFREYQDTISELIRSWKLPE